MSGFRTVAAALLLLFAGQGMSRAQGEKVAVFFDVPQDLHIWWDRIPELEAEVATSLTQLLEAEDELRFWTFEAAGAPVTDPTGLVVSLVKNPNDTTLRVRVQPCSRFIESGASLEALAEKEWILRLAAPAELEMRTISGFPERSEVGARVLASVAELLSTKADKLRAAIARGFPLGSFEVTVSPQAENDSFTAVLPIESANVRDCPLRVSEFDVRCGTSTEADIRLSVRGQGVVADYPPIPGIPANQRMLGVKVKLEALGLGENKREPVNPGAHATTLGQATLRMFFLLRIVESSDICHEGELAVADDDDEEGR